jgi:hypothetical protein
LGESEFLAPRHTYPIRVYTNLAPQKPAAAPQGAPTAGPHHEPAHDDTSVQGSPEEAGAAENTEAESTAAATTPASVVVPYNPQKPNPWYQEAKLALDGMKERNAKPAEYTPFRQVNRVGLERLPKSWSRHLYTAIEQGEATS